MEKRPDPESAADEGFFVEPIEQEVAMFMRNKRKWIWFVCFVFVCCSAIQTAAARDMTAPSESIHNAADEFQQPWRVEAERKFGEPALVAFNHVFSAVLVGFLIVLLGTLFHLMVKSNHMEQAAGRLCAGRLSFYTRMWLVSRWGYRQ